MPLICGNEKAEYFSILDRTAQITLERLTFLLASRNLWGVVAPNSGGRGPVSGRAGCNRSPHERSDMRVQGNRVNLDVASLIRATLGHYRIRRDDE